MEMVNTGHLMGPGRRPQSRILRCLYLLKARVTCVGAPDWCCIACDRFPQCVVGQQSEVISSFKSLRAGSQVLALLILFLCVILHTMFSGKSLHLLCILPFGMLCLSAISMMFVKILLAVCILVGMVVWAKADSVSSVNCVQSAIL